MKATRKQTTFAVTAIAFTIEMAILLSVASLIAPVAAQAAAVVCGINLYRRLGNVAWGRGWGK